MVGWMQVWVDMTFPVAQMTFARRASYSRCGMQDTVLVNSIPMPNHHNYSNRLVYDVG